MMVLSFILFLSHLPLAHPSAPFALFRACFAYLRVHPKVYEQELRHMCSAVDLSRCLARSLGPERRASGGEGRASDR